MYQEIRDSLVKSGVSFRANDNISEHLSPEQKAALETEVEAAVQNLLNVLVIDTANDHNTNETARRVAEEFGQRAVPLLRAAAATIAADLKA